MKKPFLILAGVLVLVSLACSFNVNLPKININKTLEGSGIMITQERTVSGFDSVELRGFGDLTIKQGSSESLTIEAEDNVIDKLTSEVVNGRLILSNDDNFTFSSLEGIHYTLTLIDLKQVNLTGLGSIDMDGLKTQNLEISESGSGNLILHNLDAQSLDIVIGGLGSVELDGTAPDQAIKITGAGNYSGADLESARAQVTVSGLGNATVWATESLNVKISGTGNVEYYGNPQLTESVTGLGRVKSKGSH